jgi:hypothetical protein
LTVIGEGSTANSSSVSDTNRRFMDFRRAAFIIATTAIFALSMWLRSAFPIFAIGPAIYDDALFVRLAESIGEGNWLGDYDELTHAKGIGYPLFLAANHLIGLPLKLSEHFLYLLAGLCLSSVVGALVRTP